jgi:inositol phosphorylceramide synthase catalytic subunit
MKLVLRFWQQDRRAACGLIAVGAYLMVARLTFGNRPEQVVLCALMAAACLWSAGTRRFAVGMLPFLLMGMVYDCLRLAQPLVASLPIWVAEPYLLEKTVFGLGSGPGRITLNELFARHNWPGVDLACGVAYMIYLYIALGFAVAIALAGRRHERLLARYGWTFFFVNVAAFLTYCFLPTAPPWYVAAHGLGPADVTTAPNPAALVRFDAMVGIRYFHEFYSRSSDVFGAIPSLHCAYPLVVFLYARELRRKWLSVTLLAFWLLVMFSAVYLQHHYVVDALLGTLYAAGGYLIERAGSASQQAASGQPSPA